MYAITLPQPLASMVALGALEVINLRRKPQRVPELVAIHAGMETVDRRSMEQLRHVHGRELADRRSQILGLASVSAIDTPEMCQLPGAWGPWCLAVRNPRVFKRPVDCFGVGGRMLFALTAEQVNHVIAEEAEAESPREAIRRLSLEQRAASGPKPGPDHDINPATRDGWTGD